MHILFDGSVVLSNNIVQQAMNEKKTNYSQRLVESLTLNLLFQKIVSIHKHDRQNHRTTGTK